MLLQNKRLIYQTPGYLFGGTLIREQNDFKKNHRSRFISQSEFDKKSSMPLGTEGQYSYVLAQRGGGLATYTDIVGSGSITASQSNGINIEGSLAGTSEMTANANLITSMLADLAGSGVLSGSMVGTVQLAAELAGAGNLEGSLKMFAGMIADLSGSGTLEGTMKGFANMSADIYVNQSEASVQQIVSGVWNAVATEYNTSGTMGEAAQTGGGGGGGATPAQIWSYSSRTLTESAGLTTEQAEQLEQVYNRVDTPVSEIAVGWNPYIEGVNGLKKGIQKIVDKVEEKGEEVKTKITDEVKSIVIPEQKEPIVNVTTEKIDTEGFMKAIKAIKPEVNVTTERVEVDLSPVLIAIQEIPQPVIPEQKEVDLYPINTRMVEIKTILEDQAEKINTIEEYIEEEKSKERQEEEEKAKEERIKQEEENLKRPLPQKFTAFLK